MSDPSFDTLLQEAIGTAPAEPAPYRPQLIDETPLERIVLRNFRYCNNLGEEIGLTVAEPRKRLWPDPVIAIHQTNRSGRKELFSLAEDPSLAYGLRLAERGHRVFAIDLFLTGERQPQDPWNSRPFYEKNPDWSVCGKDVFDLQELGLGIQEYFEEGRSGFQVFGHSQGGLVALFFAALSGLSKGTISNAAFLGKGDAEGWDPWQSQLYTSGFLNPNQARYCIAQNMDQVVASSARGGETWLIVYQRDTTMRAPVPSAQEWELIQNRSQNKVGLLELAVEHSFAPVIQDLACQFLELEPEKRIPFTKTIEIPPPDFYAGVLSQVEFSLHLHQTLLEETESRRVLAEKIAREHEKEGAEANSRAEGLTNALQAVENEVQDLRNQKQELDAALDAVRGENGQLIQQNEMISMQNSSLKGENQLLNAELGQYQKTFGGLMKAYRWIKSTTLGRRLGKIKNGGKQ